VRVDAGKEERDLEGEIIYGLIIPSQDGVDN
jgi:hypothetical protein